MKFSSRHLPLLLLPLAAFAASTQISSNKPIINFSLPSFTSEGFRSWLIRGSEAQYVSDSLINIKELTLSTFSSKGDNKLETMILSPTAAVHPTDALVSGPDTIRVINDQFEASGIDWRYEHKLKKVSINKNVRVTLRAEFKDILK